MSFWSQRTAGPIQAIHPTTGKTISVDPQRDARISADLDRELRRLPALLSWYMALRDRAETRFREASHNAHNTAEDLDVKIRSTAKPKTTETALKMAVKQHPEMRKAFRERMDAEDMYKKLSSAVEVISEKRWCLGHLVKNSALERGTKDSL